MVLVKNKNEQYRLDLKNKYMNKKKERTNRIRVKYPKIRKVLQKLYTSAYRGGEGFEEKGDGYDASTAYEEIEKALDTIEKETKEKMAEEIQRLKMKKIRTFMKAHKDTKGVDLVDIYFADEVDSFLKATDIYLKVNK